MDYFKTHHLKITRDDCYGPPPDLAGVKLEEIDAYGIQEEGAYLLFLGLFSIVEC